MNSPVTPWVLAGRIVAITGMGLTAALAILSFVAPFWLWGIGFTLAFFPFFGLIALVERWQSKHGMIGPEAEAESGE
ncbi:MAG: ComEC/Rec2 family competence protein [bacterium]